MSEKYILPELKLIKNRLKRYRISFGIRGLAKKIGISIATASRIENGKIPDLKTYFKITKCLNKGIL